MIFKVAVPVCVVLLAVFLLFGQPWLPGIWMFVLTAILIPKTGLYMVFGDDWWFVAVFIAVMMLLVMRSRADHLENIKWPEWRMKKYDEERALLITNLK